MTFLLNVLAIPIGIVAVLVAYVLLSLTVKYLQYVVVFLLIGAFGYAVGSAILEGLGWL